MDQNNESLPGWEHESRLGRGEHECCSICLDEIKSKSAVYTVCKHSYHKKCIKKWIGYGNLTCPVCRSEVAEMAVEIKIEYYINGNLVQAQIYDSKSNTLTVNYYNPWSSEPGYNIIPSEIIPNPITQLIENHH